MGGSLGCVVTLEVAVLVLVSGLRERKERPGMSSTLNAVRMRRNGTIRLNEQRVSGAAFPFPFFNVHNRDRTRPDIYG